MSHGIDLTGRRALVTGASRGLGEAIAKGLALAGAELVLASRDRDALERVAAQIRATGGKAEVVGADLTTAQGRAEVVSGAGEVDVLVNNAGSFFGLRSVISPDQEHWDQTFAVNFWAPLQIMREIGRGMAERGRGSIINISTMVTRQLSPLAGAYCTSKAALEAVSRIASMELGPHNVRCNVVAPGIMQTAIADAAMEDQSREQLTRGIPLGRQGEPEECAALVCWLASDHAAWLTGQVVYMDGGASVGNYPLMAALQEQANYADARG
jgi:NAD(P)-dependent dehydrogenase (short-subunit alcohol dehydrogenase family)